MELVHIYCALKSVQKTLRKLEFDDVTPLSGAAEWFPSTTCFHLVYKAPCLYFCLILWLVLLSPVVANFIRIPEKQMFHIYVFAQVALMPLEAFPLLLVWDNPTQSYSCLKN